MKIKLLILASLLSLIFLFNNVCVATSGQPIDSVDQNSNVVEKYKKVGINLKGELQKGNLYQKDGQYFIKFKESSLKKWVLKRLKDTNNLDIKEVSLQNALLLDAISVPNSNIRNLDNFKMFLNVTYINLEGNKNIKDYSNLKYLKELNNLNLQNNNLESIDFLKHITNKIEYLTLSNNRIKNLAPINHLINLRKLSLRNNQIVNLNPLSNMNELIHLYLTNNRLKNLKGLNAKHLFLYVGGNPLTIEGLEFIKNLELTELNIDRKVFDGIVFAKYPEYLWDIEYLNFIEEDKDE
ncbi:leucine-rich repeat domain-containing protein [Orenia marismortui]|uniref:leucine-rich repeat domain-containing protein n=1 Tax=Orenia marismortui TaxID=46469 RepID=UPI000376AC99|nr:leucine-rich repeat domain-containing protein [Orenia marismortui]